MKIRNLWGHGLVLYIVQLVFQAQSSTRIEMEAISPGVWGKVFKMLLRNSGFIRTIRDKTPLYQTPPSHSNCILLQPALAEIPKKIRVLYSGGFGVYLEHKF